VNDPLPPIYENPLKIKAWRDFFVRRRPSESVYSSYQLTYPHLLERLGAGGKADL